MDDKMGSLVSRGRRLAGRAKSRVRRRSGAGDEVSERLDRQHGRIAALERDLARIGPQVAALESRLEDMRQHLDAPTADPGELAEARSLVDEMRREHERIRARVSAAARFEERLGQLEDEVARLRKPATQS